MLTDNVSQYLITQGIATAEGTDIFIGSLPDSDASTFDNAILIRDTGGAEPDKHLPIKQPTIQILVRNVNYDTGYNKAKAIRDALHQKLDNTVLEVGADDVMTIFAMQEPTHLGMDESNRHLFTCNFIFKVRV